MARVWAELTSEELQALEEFANASNNTVFYKSNTGIVTWLWLWAAWEALISNWATSAPSFSTVWWWAAIWDPVTWGTTWSVLFVDGSWDLWEAPTYFKWDDIAKEFSLNLIWSWWDFLTVTNTDNGSLILNASDPHGQEMILNPRSSVSGSPTIKASAINFRNTWDSAYSPILSGAITATWAWTTSATKALLVQDSLWVDLVEVQDNWHSIFSSATAAQFTVTWYSDIWGSWSHNGQLSIWDNSNYRWNLQYAVWGSGIFYIDNTNDNDNADILFRTKTFWTALTPLTIKWSGKVGFWNWVDLTTPDFAFHDTSSLRVEFQSDSSFARTYAIENSGSQAIHSYAWAITFWGTGSGWGWICWFGTINTNGSYSSTFEQVAAFQDIAIFRDDSQVTRVTIWADDNILGLVGAWSTSATTTINAVNSTAQNLLKITDEWAAYFGHSNQMIFNGTGNLTLTGSLAAGSFKTNIINNVDNSRSLIVSQNWVSLFLYDWAWASTMEVKGTEVGIWVAPNQKLTIEWTMDLKEQATANTDTAWYGQIWVKNDVANTPMFTDDAGTDGTLSRLEFAQEYTKAQNFNATSLTSWAAIAWDLENNQVTKLILAINGTLSNPTNLVDWATYILTVTQDATWSRTLAYWTSYKFPGWTAPVLSTAANSVDILTFISDGTNMYWVSQLDFS